MRVKQFASLLKAATTAAFEVVLASLTIKGLLKCRGGYFLLFFFFLHNWKEKEQKHDIHIMCRVNRVSFIQNNWLILI